MDDDELAKEKARASNGGAGVPARETADSAAARLDQRITEQRRSSASEKAGKNTTGSNGTNYSEKRELPMGLKGLAPMEADIAAKSNARGLVKNAPPGAYHVSSTARQELNQMESDVAAKAQSRSSGTSTATSARSDMKAMEDDITAKLRASGSPPNGAQGSGIRSEIAQLEEQATGRSRRSETRALQTELNQMEADVASKARAMAGPGTAYSPSSAARAELIQLEAEVDSKLKARPDQPSIAPGAREELRSLEHDIASKHEAYGAAPVARARNPNVRDLDERIAYKTGISADQQNQYDVEREGRGVLQADVSKAASLPTETVDAAREKFESQQEGTAASALEDKLGGLQVPPGSYPDLEGGEDSGGKLAVAVEVKEEEEDIFIPAAVEYDPDAKPPIYRNRRFRLYCLMSCTLIVVMIAGVIGVLAQNDDDEPPIPTEAPTEQGNDAFREQLELFVGTEKLNDKGSAHYRAMEWIANEDPLELVPTSENLLQRYLLVVFYLHTHEDDKEWLSCNKPQGNEDSFCNFQRIVSIDPPQYRPVPWRRWLSKEHECQWAGLECDEFNQLRSIGLPGQEISGKLPEELTAFPFLQGITLAWNSLSGTIPDAFGTLPHLISIELHYNNLVGQLPEDWSLAKNLQTFNIAANDISGTLPADLSRSTNLKGLYFFENDIRGPFPSQITQLTSLKYIRMQRNFLTGTLPTEIGDMTPTEFWLHRTEIDGTIPTEIGLMEGVKDVRLHTTGIEGTIPEELYDLGSLVRLDLFNMGINGTLSSKVGKLTNLRNLRISDTSLSGQLPTELEKLTELEQLWIFGTDFTGTVPDGLCEIRGEFGLRVLSADCLPSSATGEQKIECSCCTECCDPATGVCEEQ